MNVTPAAPETTVTSSASSGGDKCSDPRNSSDDFVHDAAIEDKPVKKSYGWRFWVIIASLCVTSLLTAIESTVTSTALPSIARELDSRELYVWLANTLFLTSTAFQPLFGQVADVFGRRWPTIFAVAAFALGCGVSGGATSTGMLIAGRAIQGIGLGGVNILVDIIICDLVPLRDRGNFIGIVYAVFSVGSSIGPFVGGVLVQQASWRWVFYIGIPVAGTALILMLLFLHVSYTKNVTIAQKLRRIDWVGNLVLICSVTAILLAFTYGGTIRSWSAWQTILPLVLGIVGMIAFHIYEASKFCLEPTMPPRLFGNRTSAAGFALTFLQGMLTFWVVYFLPVYFQSVLQSSPTRSGVQLLPTVIVLIPFAILAGAATTATGRYKPIQIAGFALMTLGLGLFTTMDNFTSTGKWVGFQIITAAGNGLIVTSILPAIQAPLPETDTASSTATWGFIRNVGNIFGIAIPAVIFNNQFDHLSAQIEDPAVRSQLQGGRAYELASKTLIKSFSPSVRSQVVSSYAGALKLVWQVSIGFAALGFLIAWVEKEIEMRTTLETKYGLKENERKASGEKAGEE